MKQLICTVALACCVLTACGNEQKSADYDALKALADEHQGTLVVERVREPIDELPAKILSFQVDGLKQYALSISPAGPKPQAGWPVVIFSHGYVPVAADHGLRKSTGERDRPGDYYRGIPEEYARHGFLVIAPDFRGHAESEGAEFVRSKTATRWYTRDVVAVAKSVASLSEANENEMFMVGHSMGGAITLNVLSVLGSEIKAASLWSTAKSSYLQLSPESAENRLRSISIPLNFHHAVDDPVTPFSNSQAVAQGLVQDKRATLYPYPSDDHLIEGEYRTEAFQRDVALFKSLSSHD